MTSSPQPSRQPEQETTDQECIAAGPAGGRTQAEAVRQPPTEGAAGEWTIPARVQIPGYEVLELLGKGGMGVVYKARQSALDRIVALKMILHAEHAGSAERQRFQVEAEAAARLQHSNIIQVFEVGTHEGLPYLTLEYCPGGSLAHRLNGTPWPIRDAAQLVETLATATHAAHTARVVHRDLNPANVLLTATGQPKITDFGLAKKLGEQGRTQTGAVVGTPSYMSPEQADGKAKEVGPATDIYSLGAILYELLTGRPPFKAATPLNTVLQVVADEPTPVRRLRQQVPRDLETICHKCLEKDPARRFPSAESLAEDLRRFLADEPIRVRRISRWERGVKWARRRPAVLVAAAASIAALLCLIALMGVLWFLVLRNASPMEPQNGMDQHNVSATPPVPKAKLRTPPTKKEELKGTANGRLSRAALDRLMRATVYLRVSRPSGEVIQGSGFFCSAEARNLIITNAHVLGMLEPESSPPQLIEVFLNSGQEEEWSPFAVLRGVDRESDLALVEIRIPPKLALEPLSMRSAKGLNLGDPLHIAGFPFGEGPGREITINPTTVSALRTKDGLLERFQVNRGMAPGNSGGPVVDTNGVVVGVAIAGIPGYSVKFAIPGDRVLALLLGRPIGLRLHQPYKLPDKDNRIFIPLRVETIDPRRRIKSMALEVWVGNKPATRKQAFRPGAASQRPKLPGDSDRHRFALQFDGTDYQGDVPLPELPSDKIWWQQLMWVNEKGESQWSEARELRLPSDPVMREPATLLLSNWRLGSVRNVKLTIDNNLRLSDQADAGLYNIYTEVVFRETVLKSDDRGATLQLQYLKDKVRRDIAEPKKSKQPSPLLSIVKDSLPSMPITLHLDSLGNIVRHTADSPFRERRLVESLRAFHLPIQQALEEVAVALPAKGTVQPLERWGASRTLSLNKDDMERAILNLTFTYQGLRTSKGRKEAVLEISGDVAGTGKKSNPVGGKATGSALVDVASGQVLLAEITTVLDMKSRVIIEAIDPNRKQQQAPRETRVRATMKVRLEHKP